jgi:hypothetical protein
MSRNGSNSKTAGIEPYIIDCMSMRLTEKESLAFLEEKGYSIGHTELYRLKQEIKQSTQQRLHLIASQEFQSQHLERIQTLVTINREMWANYHIEKNPFKRVQILEKIEENQDYLSSYYDSTRWVLEQGAKLRKKQKEVNTNNSSQ